MEGLKRLDLAEAQRSGALSIAVNDPVFPPRLPRIFDGNTETLSRTEDVNPLILTFTFKEEILLKAVRLYPSYSSYDWILRAHPQAESLIVRSAVAKEWSWIDLPTAVKTLSVRIELKRLQRDNFVHLNEIEFYSQ